jgi:hypothetical protein
MFLDNLRILGDKTLTMDRYRLFDGLSLVNGKKFFLLSTSDKGNIFVGKGTILKKISGNSKVVAIKSTKHLIFDKTDVSYLGKKTQVNNCYTAVKKLKIEALKKKRPVIVNYLPAIVNPRMVFHKASGTRGKTVFVLGKSSIFSNKMSLFLNRKVPYFVLQRYLNFSRLLKCYFSLFRGFFLVNKFNLMRKNFSGWLALPFYLLKSAKNAVNFLKFMAVQSFYKRKFRVYRRLITLGFLLKYRIKAMSIRLIKFYKPFILYYSIIKKVYVSRIVMTGFFNIVKNYRNFFFNNFFVSKFKFIMTGRSSFVKFGISDVVRLFRLLNINFKAFSGYYFDSSKILSRKEKMRYFFLAKIYKRLYFKFMRKLVGSYVYSVHSQSRFKDFYRKSGECSMRGAANERNIPSLVTLANNFKLNLLRRRRRFALIRKKRKFFSRISRRKLKLSRVVKTLQELHRFKNKQYIGIMKKFSSSRTVQKIRLLMYRYIKESMRRKYAKYRYLANKNTRWNPNYRSKFMNFKEFNGDKVYRHRKSEANSRKFFKNAAIR